MPIFLFDFHASSIEPFYHCHVLRLLPIARLFGVLAIQIEKGVATRITSLLKKDMKVRLRKS